MEFPYACPASSRRGRLRAEGLEPLRTDQRAVWHAPDFAAGPRPDGTYPLSDQPVTRSPAPVIMLEGVSARPELIDLLDLAVFVEVSPTSGISD
ncbi:MAG: hypothetical protein AAGI71_13970 [Bacteroidota bacterium]